MYHFIRFKQAVSGHSDNKCLAIAETVIYDWITISPELDVANGKPEPFCKICNCHIRAHYDLIVHSKLVKHKERKMSINRTQQKSLEDYNVVIQEEDKVLKLLKVGGKNPVIRKY
ncbi:uncharacterized protein LOC122502165 [Leptopilina heterotoma]|uniref:uncharacterized protein LOC122502165 n=1 Tax=Leptopilina heterotoma TaxID=63436 RepID=UPI001CAA3FA4|nr:uncharacterized protein LOC122502165 [Leptopilina heterotoma]